MQGKEIQKIDLQSLHITNVRNCVIVDLNTDGKNELVIRGWLYGEVDVIDKLVLSDNQGNLFSEIELEHAIRQKLEESVFTGKPLNFSGKYCYVEDVTNDGGPDILIDSQNSVLRIFDKNGVPYNSSIDLSGEHISCVTITDVTGDRHNEILVGMLDGLRVFKIIKDSSSQPGTQYTFNTEEIWRDEHHITTAVTGCHFDIMSSHRNAEILLTGNKEKSKGFVSLLSSTGNNIWQKQFLNTIQTYTIGDVTADGQKEIVVSIDSDLWILDLEGNHIGQLKVGQFIHYCHVTDLTRDGKNEILIGSSYKNGRLTALQFK